MKKIFIILGILLIAVIAALFWMQGKQPKEFDKRVTLSKKETRPYATKVMHTLLQQCFPKAIISDTKQNPIDWYDNDSSENGNTLFFVVSEQFLPNTEELRQLVKFIEKGNVVFVATSKINDAVSSLFKVDILSTNFYYSNSYEDSVNLHLKNPAYVPEETYFNPGFTSNAYFTFNTDTTAYTNLGNNHNNKPNFIEASIGNGKIILHSDPFLFTNYFILSNNNANYISHALNTITNKPTKIIWDEYYLYKFYSSNNKPKGSLSTLLSYPSFAWAFWLCLILGILYLIVFIKRKQRFIQEIKPLQNDSLAFVQTIGRLYYDNKDHLNLATKMSVYLLEHIRTKYKIATNNLEEDFIKTLSGKSGYDLEKTQTLIDSIVQLNKRIDLKETELINYYKLFNHFYKNT